MKYILAISVPLLLAAPAPAQADVVRTLERGMKLAAAAPGGSPLVINVPNGRRFSKGTKVELVATRGGRGAGVIIVPGFLNLGSGRGYALGRDQKLPNTERAALTARLSGLSNRDVAHAIGVALQSRRAEARRLEGAVPKVDDFLGKIASDTTRGRVLYDGAGGNIELHSAGGDTATLVVYERDSDRGTHAMVVTGDAKKGFSMRQDDRDTLSRMMLAESPRP